MKQSTFNYTSLFAKLKYRALCTNLPNLLFTKYTVYTVCCIKATIVTYTSVLISLTHPWLYICFLQYFYTFKLALNMIKCAQTWLSNNTNYYKQCTYVYNSCDTLSWPNGSNSYWAIVFITGNLLIKHWIT